MTTRMLIDARHAEETRVAVLQGNRIEEFDFESAEHKQIKGNIYLAKVTRVEPSLQAAFVDFGGNRHGFLAFSEIHPDYYQIPKQDREALLAEEAAQAAEEEALRASEDEDDEDEDGGQGDYTSAHDDDDLDDESADGRDHRDDAAGRLDGGVIEIDTSEKDQVSTIEAGHVEDDFDDEGDHDETDQNASDYDASNQDEGDQDRGGIEESAASADDDSVEEGEDAPRDGRRQGRARSKQAEELRDRRMALRRRYKIQDVIQRRQVLLVQVVKEERGNKGAALTSYLSLAGRYCVLMPNSSSGGGISRKISSSADRKRLKSIVSELELPRSMGCIVRTAGLARTKTEIKRDFDYLARLWDEIRENTLGSSAPALIHSDSDLIKRAIRDIYNREIEDVVVEGEQGFYAARAFMKLLMPSHARKVKAYADPVPLFQRYGAEDQLTAMYDPVVQLRSGGYIVINPTEALVSIDINSGRSTKEYGIEATALNTNLEAAREIARQLRLRDMAGLVVIDFIDMEHGSNVRKVEKVMKDSLKNDRARIQVGRISSFGLMEMSRQRLRTGVLEASTRMCPHCDGTGLVRTASSAGLAALRLIEDEAARGRGTIITLFASTEASIYLLNVKRADLGEIEYRYGVRVEVIPEGENEGAKMRVGSSGPRPESPPKFEPILIADDDLDDIVEEDEIDEELEEARESEGDRSETNGGDARGEDGDGRRKRRKRRRGGRDRDDAPVSGERELEDAEAPVEDGEGDEAASGEAVEAGEHDDADGEAPRKRRRRGRRRRGGRRFDEAGDGVGETEGTEASEAGEASDADLDADADADGGDEHGDVQAGAEPSEAADEAMGTEEGFPATAGALEPDAEDEAEAPALPDMLATSVDDGADVPTAPVKRTRRKAASADAADGTGTQGPAIEEEAADAPTKAPRTRRKKADVEVAASEGTPQDGPDAEVAEVKPKRTRRKKAETAIEPSVEAAPDQTEAAEPEFPSITSVANDLAVSSDDGESAAPSNQEGEPAPTAAESLDEPVTIAPDTSEPIEAEVIADDGPPRRGWWQRTFGA